jgi:hypothetical protein
LPRRRLHTANVTAWSEWEFARLARRAGTVILDARSREKYDLLHVTGAINLSFPDIAVTTLREQIPDPST